MRAARAYLRVLGLRRRGMEGVRHRLLSRTTPAPSEPPRSLGRTCIVQRRDVAGHPVWEVAPRSGATATRLLYLHGGGYVHPLGPPHWNVVRALVAATGARVTLPAYPLAPEHDHRAAFALLETLHADLLSEAEPADIVFCGDSAGGGLALGLAVALRDAGTALPGRLILFAPWLDLTLSDPAIPARDPILRRDWLRQAGAWWAGDADPALPHLSPANADLAGLPPIDIHHGTDDLLVTDARRLAARGGAQVRLLEYPGAVHSFMVAPFLPESREVYRRLATDLAAPARDPS